MSQYRIWQTARVFPLVMHILVTASWQLLLPHWLITICSSFVLPTGPQVISTNDSYYLYNSEACGRTQEDYYMHSFNKCLSRTSVMGPFPGPGEYISVYSMIKSQLMCSWAAESVFGLSQEVVSSLLKAQLPLVSFLATLSHTEHPKIVNSLYGMELWMIYLPFTFGSMNYFLHLIVLSDLPS